MDSLLIRPSGSLSGSIPISGAKNSALPLMISSLLTSETLILENIPRLADVSCLLDILTNHGVSHRGIPTGTTDTSTFGQTIEFCAKDIVSTTASYDLVRKMRASFWVIGPLLARCGVARVSLPGGCAIGTRPIDLFISGLESLGASITVDGGYVDASCPEGLFGSHIVFPKVSVGATHVMLMSSVLATGETILDNAAQEPEVADLIECLTKMGACIEQTGSRIVIQGVSSLHGAAHRVVSDRIEAGTFAACVSQTGGELLLQGANPSHLESPLAILRQMGVVISEVPDGISVSAAGDRLRPVDITTSPYPGFPTDLQAQFMALTTCSSGVSSIEETIFENRFMHVQELNRLGSSIHIDGQVARVEGVDYLSGAPVMATDLRASMSLVIAGLVARGETRVNRIYHLDRGFEGLEDKLSCVGADIERIS